MRKQRTRELLGLILIAIVSISLLTRNLHQVNESHVHIAHNHDCPATAHVHVYHHHCDICAFYLNTGEYAGVNEEILAADIPVSAIYPPTCRIHEPFSGNVLFLRGPPQLG